jgi:hypothetical protein
LIVVSARESAVAGVQVGPAAHPASLFESVRAAYISGLDLTLWVLAGFMAVASALAFMLRARAREAPAVTGRDESPQELVA